MTITVSAEGQPTGREALIFVPSGAAEFDIQLPRVLSEAPIGWQGPPDWARIGFSVVIKDRDGNANSNNISVLASGEDLIDGESSQTISSDYGSLTLVASGVGAWSII